MPDRRVSQHNVPNGASRAVRRTGGRRGSDDFPRSDVTKKVLFVVVTVINFFFFIVDDTIQLCMSLIGHL